ncbi:MAG: hypothetical protein AAGF87_14055 [Bacteroidota bacterium]
MGAQTAFDYNALRDDHTASRKRKFFYFLLDVSLFSVGAYFIFRYATGWGGESSLFWWWLFPGALCLLLGTWSIIGFLKKTKSTDRHLERFVKIDGTKIHWWLDKNETAQNVRLDDIKSIEYTTRDVIIRTTADDEYTLHTYLILAPKKELELRQFLKSQFGKSG